MGPCMREAEHCMHYTRYNHRQLGRVDKMEANIQNPNYCFAAISTMKSGSYNVYVILRCGLAGYGEIQTGSYSCAAE